MAETMRVMGATGDGVEMIEIPKPTPGRGEVRVKVIASAVNAAEEKIIRGDFVGRFLHAKTSPLVLGWDFAGTVDALGDGVTDIDEGAAVWGHLAYSMPRQQGAFAEYVTFPARLWRPRPTMSRTGVDRRAPPLGRRMRLGPSLQGVVQRCETLDCLQVSGLAH
jgi:NADPH:quinone reductase-like Zn-dependent oxidoreductase